jgi:hypothetical protein
VLFGRKGLSFCPEKVHGFDQLRSGLPGFDDLPAFLRTLEKNSRLQLNLRDDPLMLQDEFRILAGSGKQDVTQKFALG